MFLQNSCASSRVKRAGLDETLRVFYSRLSSLVFSIMMRLYGSWKCACTAFCNDFGKLWDHEQGAIPVKKCCTTQFIVIHAS